MRIHSGYLKRFVNVGGSPADLRQLLVSVGIEVAEIVPVSATEAVLEIEITPNRPDWLSHWGVARDLAAKLDDGRLTLPTLSPPAERADVPFALEIADGEDCPRYTGCIVSGVAVGPSSPELARLIEELGLRPINNLVDISNLVMLTTGQPLHFFDRRALRGDRIRVRRAVSGEQLTLLDNQTLALDGRHLVIADAERPVALAGIMGGLDSGVSDASRDIFIESACFKPSVVRLAARSGGLRTDASYRFERGSDPQGTAVAVALALQLMERETGRAPHVVWYRDLQPRPHVPVVVRLPKTFPAAAIGIDLPPQRVEAILKRLGFALEDGGDAWDVRAPSFRVDINCRQDLVEEVARLHGYDKLGSVLPPIVRGDAAPDGDRDRLLRLKQTLAAAGFHEAINYVFQSPAENRLFAGQTEFVTLQNPLGSDYSVLKNSLLAGLLKNTAHNLNQGAGRVCLFETGMTHALAADGPEETERLALTACGDLRRGDWQGAATEIDIYAVKTQLAALFGRFRIRAEFASARFPGFAADACLRVLVAGRPIGWLGRLDDEAVARFGIERPVYGAELELEPLLAAIRESWFTPWSIFPATRRDFSFLVDRDLSYEQLRQAIERGKPAELESYELMDLYSGSSVPADRVSLSMAFIYRGADRTLSGDEVNELHRALTARLCAELRLVQR